MCAFSKYEFYVLIFISVLEGGAEVAPRVVRSPSLEGFQDQTGYNFASKSNLLGPRSQHLCPNVNYFDPCSGCQAEPLS